MHTNSIEKVLSYNQHWRPDNVTFSVSQLASSSEYQLWLAFNKTPSDYVTDISNNVNSVIGSGFHYYAALIIAQENPENNYAFFSDIYGTIPDMIKEKLYEEFIDRGKLD